MGLETFTLSQEELQRLTVISRCVQGNLTCARAAELLELSPRMSNGSNRATGKAAQRLWRRSAAAGPPPTHARIHTQPHSRSGAHTLRRLQRSSSAREARRTGRLLAEPRDLAPPAPRQRHRLATQTPASRSSSAPSALGPRGRTRPARWLSPRLAGRPLRAAHRSGNAG